MIKNTWHWGKLMSCYLFILLFLYITSCSPSEAFIQTAIANTQQALPTHTIEPTKIPTKVPVFRDSKSIRIYFFGEYPKAECETTEDGWRCHRILTQLGLLYVDYVSIPGELEAYEVMYTGPSGLEEDGVYEVISGLDAILQDKLVSDSIIDWIFEKGLELTTKDENNSATFVVDDIYVWLTLNEVVFSYSLCCGNFCN